MNHCPCGLTQEQLDLHPNLVGSNGRCTAEFADQSFNDDGTPKICNRPLAAHPHAPPVGGTQDSPRLLAIERELLRLKIAQTHHGVSTEAEWAQDLKNQGRLSYDQSFQNFLEGSKYPYWPTNQLPTFPALKSSESDVCQPFVDSVINLIAADQGFRIKTDGQLFSKTSSLQSLQTITSANDKVSYSTRKPDVVIYNGNLKGVCAISIVGDVRGCRSTTDFPDAEVGHILDMSKVLLDEHQFSRTLLYSFLTDGFRFQFFRCRKDSTGSFEFKASSVFTGLDGWQVLFGLLRLPAEDLGLVMDVIDGWHIKRGLGKGNFARVYAATQENNNSSEYVLKYFASDKMDSGKREKDILTLLNANQVQNIPVVKHFLEFPEKYALIVSPVGIPILPAPSNVLITPQLICNLIVVLESAHRLGIAHRDVKPANIFLTANNEVILNDWGSAAALGISCKYVGTPLYGEQKTAEHTPSVALDLRSLVKTAFTLKQRKFPICRTDDWSEIENYWYEISRTFPGFQDLLDVANSESHERLRQHFSSAFW